MERSVYYNRGKRCQMVSFCVFWALSDNLIIIKISRTEVAGVFSGMSNHSIDSKGRIVLPAKFREELGERFFITQGFGNRCIQVLSRDEFERVSARIMELPADKSIVLQYVFNGAAVETAPNAQGRIIIPQALREYAKLDGDALVIGMIKRIEIWNKSEYDAFIESRRDVIEEALGMLRL